jgi:small subunit ribosomal protein S2
MSEITMKQLLESGVHFGHQTNRWNPKMKPYIYGARSGIYIIDLQKTLARFQEAEKYVRDMAQAGKKILFVATKKQAQELIAEEATRCGMYYINQRWLGGTLTNFATIRKSIARLHELEKMDEENQFDLLHKKEALRMRREIAKLNKFFRGIKHMKDLPDALFIVDTRKEKIAQAEGRKLGIKIIAMVDTNANPEDVDFPIPANDDAMRSIKLFSHRIADICLEGQEMHRIHQEKENAKKEEARKVEAKKAEAKKAEAKKEEAKKAEAKKAEAKKAEAKKVEAKKAETKESAEEKPVPSDTPASIPVASENENS